MSEVVKFAARVAARSGQASGIRNFSGKAESFVENFVPKNIGDNGDGDVNLKFSQLDGIIKYSSQELQEGLTPLKCGTKNFWIEKAEDMFQKHKNWNKYRNKAIANDSQKPQNTTEKEWIEAVQNSQQEGQNKDLRHNCFAGTAQR